MFFLSGRQSVMLLQELFGAQISDPDSQQNHQQTNHDPEGSVGGQQVVQRRAEQGAKIDSSMNHHGDRKVIGLPVEPGQQDADEKHRWPGKDMMSWQKENR